jgi:glycosyltransferase involved in cell wall biosynthesis
VTHPVSERIALVAPSAEAAAILRRDLIEALTSRGHRVLCLTPPGAGKHIRILRGLGALHRVIETPPPSLRMISDWQTITALIAQFKDWEPNIVLSFGLRTLVLAAMAARRAGVLRVVTMVNGLPSDGVESVGRRRFVHAIRASDAVVFHNQENRRFLTDHGLLPADVPSIVVPGSGIDLAAFPAAPLPAQDNGLVFLMLARLERRRGVLEYKAAAQRLKKSWPNATFRFAGPASGQPDFVKPEVLTEGGAVEYLGHLDDVYPALAASHVYVYPTYGEGMPRSVLEALAVGRPVITTLTPGCSVTVDEKVSGCLIPPANTDALAIAMESYLRNPDQLPAGSRAARLKATRRFNADEVNAALLRTLGLG